jgi:mycothiol synthase
VLALVEARDRVDMGRPDITMGDLLDTWQAAEFDLAADALVCEDGDGELVGYAVVRRFGTYAAVDPAHEGEGIGAALLDWIERRQRALGWEQLRTAVVAGNARAERLVAGRGYSLVRSYRRMIAELNGGPRLAESPEGVRLRPLEVERDAAALYRIDRDAFASVAGTEPESFEAFSEEHFGAHDLAPLLSIVAARGEQPIGFVLTRRWVQESAGYLDILAVDPSEQGKGLGRTLLLAAFNAIAAVGLTEVQLGVAADNEKALRLYESVGMRPRFQFDVYERPARS